jgi:hypothetical protein
VKHHNDAVARDADVGLDVHIPEIDCPLECMVRVLGPQDPAPPMRKPKWMLSFKIRMGRHFQRVGQKSEVRSQKSEVREDDLRSSIR